MLQEGDLSVSEISGGAEQMRIKEEIWEEERIGRVDHNREALDRFAVQHQRRVKEEWSKPKNGGCFQRKLTFGPMKVEIFPRSPGEERFNSI